MEIKTVVTHGFTENIHENTCFKYPNRTYKLCWNYVEWSILNSVINQWKSRDKATTKCSLCPFSRKGRRKNTVTVIRGLGQKRKADKLPYKEGVNLLNALSLAILENLLVKINQPVSVKSTSLSVNCTKQFSSNRVFKCSYCPIPSQMEI